MLQRKLVRLLTSSLIIWDSIMILSQPIQVVIDKATDKPPSEQSIHFYILIN